MHDVHMRRVTGFVPPGHSGKAPRMRFTTRCLWISSALLAVSVLSSCGSTAPSAGEGVGERFTSAVSASAWGRACAYLAPDTRANLEKSAGKACPAALEEESPPDAGPLDAASSFGTMTQLRYREDTIFLARFKSGWKVMALECSPVPGHPYDCRIQGG